MKKKKVYLDMVTGTIHKSNVPLHILCNHKLPSKKLPIFKLANRGDELETVQNGYLNSWLENASEVNFSSYWTFKYNMHVCLPKHVCHVEANYKFMLLNLCINTVYVHFWYCLMRLTSCACNVSFLSGSEESQGAKLDQKKGVKVQ